MVWYWSKSLTQRRIKFWLHWFSEKSPECSLLNLRATRVAFVAAMILICFSNTASTGYSLRPLITMLRQYLSGKPIVRQLPFKSAFVLSLSFILKVYICLCVCSCWKVCSRVKWFDTKSNIGPSPYIWYWFQTFELNVDLLSRLDRQ